MAEYDHPWELDIVRQAFACTSLEQSPADVFKDDRVSYQRAFAKLVELYPELAESTQEEMWYFRSLTELANHCRDLFGGTLKKPGVRFTPSENGKKKPDPPTSSNGEWNPR